MKKLILISLLSVGALFQYCSSTKKAQAVQNVTYAANVAPIITANCSPCHIPPQGNKLALNTYEAAKTNLDNMVVRMQKNTDERGFMPMRHPKLSDSTINVFTQWKAEGFIEK